jgi:hypothetical protein
VFTRDQYPTSYVTFRKKLLLYDEDMLAARPSLKLEDTLSRFMHLKSKHTCILEPLCL